MPQIISGTFVQKMVCAFLILVLVAAGYVAGPLPVKAGAAHRENTVSIRETHTPDDVCSPNSLYPCADQGGDTTLPWRENVSANSLYAPDTRARVAYADSASRAASNDARYPISTSDEQESGINGDVNLDSTLAPLAPGLSVVKTVDNVLAQPGDILTYTIHVSNTGTVALHTSITDTLPLPITPITWTSPVSVSGNTFVWTPTITVSNAWTATVVG